MGETLRQLYADDPQTFANNLRTYINSNGIPPTAENYNRLSLAVAQEMRGGGEGMPQFDAAVERTMAPRSGARRAATAAPATAAPVAAPQSDAAPDVRLDAGEGSMIDKQFTNLRELTTNPQMPPSALREGSPPPNARGDVTRGAQQAYDNANAAADAGVDPRGGGAASARAAQEGNIARPGTIPRARYIDENDPMAGYLSADAPGGRQADEEGVNQRSLGTALLAPIAAAAMLPAAGASAIPQLNVTLQRQMLERAGQQGLLRGPSSGAAAVARTPQPAPIPSGGGAAALPPPAAAAPNMSAMRSMTGQAAQPARNAASSRDALRARLQQRNAPNRRATAAD